MAIKVPCSVAPRHLRPGSQGGSVTPHLKRKHALKYIVKTLAQMALVKLEFELTNQNNKIHKTNKNVQFVHLL